MAKGSRSLILVLFLACGLGQGTGREDKGYQLIGKIKQQDKEFSRNALPQVFLDGSRIPYAAFTQADVSGNFKFKDLRPDLFTLTIYIPRAGQYRQTVEVSPGLADSRKRVFVDVIFRPNLESRSLAMVSSAELAIPGKALKEYTKARNKLGNRDPAAAVAHLKKAVALAPQFCEAWNSLGTLAYKSGDLQLAESYFREALKQDPDYYPSMVNLGGTLLSQGRSDDALPLNLSAVRTMPDDALAHSQLGLNYYYLGQFTEAEECLKKAVSLDPGHFSYPQLTLANIYLGKKDFASAARALEQFIQLHPDAKQAPAAQRQIEDIHRNLIRDSRFEIRN
jgi:tetratricopeptide (TPR) repeat protein